jgi:hypothetical protein
MLALLLAIAACAPAQQKPPVSSGLALNLAAIVDWGTEHPFTDFYLSSRTWTSNAEGKGWGQGGPLDLDEYGWVRRLAPGQYATAALLGAGGHRAGRYVCSYAGKGHLEFHGCAHVTSHRPGRYELELTAAETLNIDLKRTDPDDPLRQIRILPAALADAATVPLFQPEFLARVKQFRAVRLMDWMLTNNSEQRSWSDRPRIDDATQTKKGVALEYMLALCNEAKVAPWFCMPHLADDNYVEQFAKQVKQKLSPSLPVYIEHSNEVWNNTFAQGRYAADRGMQLKLSDNRGQAQFFYHSRRSVEIFRIWEKVFGGTDRLVRVLGSQFGNQWGSEQLLTFESAGKHADALAVAPYFGYELGEPAGVDDVLRGGLDAMFARLRQEVAGNGKRFTELVALAQRYHVNLIAYEGGQHLVGHNGAENRDELTALFQAANRDARMKDLYLQDFTNWQKAGGRLYAVFSSIVAPNKWGSWGLLETALQDPLKAPKYQAVLAVLKQFPRGW